MSDYWCSFCGQRTSMMGHSSCQKHGKPRLRILPNGWIRHFGGPMPNFLEGKRIRFVPRSGNAEFIQGYKAEQYRGWEHSGFSGDIVAWRMAETTP